MLCVTLSQLATTQIGNVNVVSNTKYNDRPSTPMCMCRKLSVLYSTVNWYWLEFESNSPHIIIDSANVTTVVSRATRLIREICCGVDSVIGARVSAPSKGISSRAVSILYIIDS